MDNVVSFENLARFASNFEQKIIKSVGGSGGSGGSGGGNYISVKTFGAVGDGVADDTAALKKAALSGKAVFFPRGVYLLHGQIDQTVDINWIGEGDDSIIRLMPTYQGDPENYGGRVVYNCYMIAQSRELSLSIELRNLVFDANKEAYDQDIYKNGSSRHDHTVCLDLKKPKNVIMDGVTIKNALIEGCYVWSVPTTESVIINNCKFISNGFPQEDGSGLHIEGNHVNTVITNCIFNGNGFHGILFGSTFGAVVSNITCKNNGFDGVCLWGGAVNNVLNNVRSTNNRAGISFKSGFSPYELDEFDESWMEYTSCNNITGLNTSGNVYGVMFGNSNNNLISGLLSSDQYNYSVCYSTNIKTNCNCKVANAICSPTVGASKILNNTDGSKFTITIN